MTALAGEVGGKREGRVPPSDGAPDRHFLRSLRGGSAPTRHPRTVHEPWPKGHSAKTAFTRWMQCEVVNRSDLVGDSWVLETRMEDWS